MEGGRAPLKIVAADKDGRAFGRREPADHTRNGRAKPDLATLDPTRTALNRMRAAGRA